MTNKIKKHLKNFYFNNCQNGHWNSFEHFLLEVGTPPKNNMRLTRKCIQKGFVSGNLGWATHTNHRSRYLVNTLSGNIASLKAACEQDGVKYQTVYSLIKNYSLTDCPQAAFNFGKLDKTARKAVRRKACKEAIKNFQLV